MKDNIFELRRKIWRRGWSAQFNCDDLSCLPGIISKQLQLYLNIFLKETCSKHNRRSEQQHKLLKFGLDFWDKHKRKHKHKDVHTSKIGMHSASNTAEETRLWLVEFLRLCLCLVHASSHLLTDKHRRKHKKNENVSISCAYTYFTSAFSCAYACAYVKSANQA